MVEVGSGSCPVVGFGSPAAAAAVLLISSPSSCDHPPNLKMPKNPAILVY